jgi:eukaryotic-like serine/threonine-protein kinase
VAHAFDARREILTGEPRTIVAGVSRSSIETHGFFSASENGVLAFRPGSIVHPSRLTWFDRRGNATGTIGEMADYSNPALSRDGERLAVCLRNTAGKRDIWVFDLVRGSRTQLTFDPADETNPSWSRDGSQIAYTSDRRGHRDMYVRSSSGTGQERPLLESNDEKTVLDWSPDGKTLVYVVLSPKTGADLWMLPLAGNVHTPELFLGTSATEDNAQVSPDGRWLLYRSSESGRLELYVQPLPPNGQKWVISNTSATDFQWRPDGREILYTTRVSMYSVDVKVSSTIFQPGPPKELFRLPPMRVIGRNRFVVSRDGQRFLIVTAEQAEDESLAPLAVILNWPLLLKNP